MRLSPSVFEDGESFNGSPIGFCFVVLLKNKHNLFSKTLWIHFHTLLLLIHRYAVPLPRWGRQVSTAAIVKKVGAFSSEVAARTAFPSGGMGETDAALTVDEVFL